MRLRDLSYSTLYQLRYEGKVLHTKNDVCIGSYIRGRLHNNYPAATYYNKLGREFDFLDLFLRIPTEDYRATAEKFLEYTLSKFPQRIFDAIKVEEYSQEKLDELYSLWEKDYDGPAYDRREMLNKKGLAWKKVTFDLSKIGVNDFYLAFILFRYPQEACNIVNEFISRGEITDEMFILSHIPRLDRAGIHWDHSIVPFHFVAHVLEHEEPRSKYDKWNWSLVWPHRWSADPPLNQGTSALAQKENITAAIGPQLKDRIVV